ncbi:MAG: hypothetical protein JWO93_734 [Micrococcaceae bacterium]|nr:hypothetical protein [Micrococcaceae bacterium]
MEPKVAELSPSAAGACPLAGTPDTSRKVGIVPLPPASRENPATTGRAAASWAALIMPTACRRSGQRNPVAPSAPKVTSRPPPQASPSTSSVSTPERAAWAARRTAAVEAPAPPQPPRTPTTRPPLTGSCSPERYSASHWDPSGRSTTRSAATAEARCHNWEDLPDIPTNIVGRSRRGSTSRMSSPRRITSAVASSSMALPTVGRTTASRDAAAATCVTASRIADTSLISSTRSAPAGCHNCPLPPLSGRPGGSGRHGPGRRNPAVPSRGRWL